MTKVLGGLVILLLVSACTNNNSPEAVAQQFWQAMAEGNVSTARELATENSMDGIGADSERRLENLEFGKARVAEGGESALVATSLVSVRGDSRINLTFDTVLEQQQGQWRVNFGSTTQSMLGSSFQQLQDALAETISEAGNALGNAMDEALDEATGQMSQVLQEAARDMQKAADDIRAELEQLKQDETKPDNK